MAIRKVCNDGKKDKSKNEQTAYFFDINKCKKWKLKDGSLSKTYTIRKNSLIHQEHLKFENSDEFKELYK